MFHPLSVSSLPIPLESTGLSSKFQVEFTSILLSSLNTGCNCFQFLEHLCLFTQLLQVFLKSGSYSQGSVVTFCVILSLLVHPLGKLCTETLICNLFPSVLKK